MDNAPDWVLALPSVNAVLNGTATLLLLAGFAAIKTGRRDAHKRIMLTAFGVSVAFLACYLTYHFGLKYYTGSSSKPFPENHAGRPVYLVILVTHVVLAATVPVLAILTIVRAFRQDWERHRRIAKITFPIWVYVSVTGVIIYWMLYHWAA